MRLPNRAQIFKSRNWKTSQKHTHFYFCDKVFLRRTQFEKKIPSCQIEILQVGASLVSPVEAERVRQKKRQLSDTVCAGRFIPPAGARAH